MLAVVEALICFDIARDKIDVLSIGCGNDKYVVSKAETANGGIWHWRKIMAAAMRLQSLAATNQARLLLGPPSVIRLDPPAFEPPIRLDDWSTSVAKLPAAAEAIVAARGEEIAALFMNDLALPFEPVEMP